MRTDRLPPVRPGRRTQKMPIQRSKRLGVIGSTLLMIGCATGCVGKGAIRSEAIDGLCRRIVARDIAYINSDTSLSPEQKKTNLRDGEILTRTLDAAREAREK